MFYSNQRISRQIVSADEVADSTFTLIVQRGIFMLIDIQQRNGATSLTFKASDTVSLDEIVSVTKAITAGKYYFSAFLLDEIEFKEFMESIPEGAVFWILVGLDEYGRPFVTWGKDKIQD